MGSFLGWADAIWPRATLGMGDLSSTAAIEEQTEMVSPGNAGVQILCTILTAASSKFLLDYWSAGPVFHSLCTMLGAHWIKHVKPNARWTGNVTSFVLICFFRNVSLHKINGFIPQLRYIKKDKTGALEKSGYSVWVTAEQTHLTE